MGDMKIVKMLLQKLEGKRPHGINWLLWLCSIKIMKCVVINGIRRCCARDYMVVF